MKWFANKHIWIPLALLLASPIIVGFFIELNKEALETIRVESGSVQRVISVSGLLEADQLVDLSFPSSGRLASLLVTEGDTVKAGNLLATTGSGALAAERQRAIAQLMQAEATRDQLMNGLTVEERTVSSTTVEQARIAFETTRASEAQKVARAYSDLLSTDLEAKATDPEENIPPPQVSGSYSCDAEGSYRFEIYPSSADSGYSVRYSGLENGIAAVSTVQPVVIGECGLELTFTDFTTYDASEWTVQIPNTLSETYVQRMRTLELTEEQAAQNIANAEYALRLAEDTATDNIAPPRVEALINANAAVIAAQADITRSDVLLADKALYAPFDGTVTNISSSVGEVVTDDIMTLVAKNSFTLRVRIPEIDIRNIAVGLPATARFDASLDEVFDATIDYISPVATLIDGVSYFEATLSLATNKDWFRDGLNADVDIITDEISDTTVIANRYIFDTEDGKAVLRLEEGGIATTTITINLSGTDGFAAITGLNEGDTVVAPR